MDDKITDTTKNTDQEPQKDTTLDLTGLKHNDEETMMSEAIEKVNQVENLEQLKKIDNLTSQETSKDEPNKETEGDKKDNEEKKENNKVNQSKPEVKEDKNKNNSTKASSEPIKPIEKPKETVSVKPEPKKTEIKLGHNTETEKSKKDTPKNKDLKEEDIVLEMSGGINEKKRKKSMPKVKIGVPKFDKSKKIIYIVIGGLITATAIASIVIFIVLPKVKTYIDNKTVDEAMTTTSTKPTKPEPETIREQIDTDRISIMLLESSDSSILKDVLLDTQEYPISDINKELETIKDEQSTQE